MDKSVLLLSFALHRNHISGMILHGNNQKPFAIAIFWVVTKDILTAVISVCTFILYYPVS